MLSVVLCLLRVLCCLLLCGVCCLWCVAMCCPLCVMRCVFLFGVGGLPLIIVVLCWLLVVVSVA